MGKTKKLRIKKTKTTDDTWIKFMFIGTLTLISFIWGSAYENFYYNLLLMSVLLGISYMLSNGMAVRKEETYYENIEVEEVKKWEKINGKILKK